MRKKESQRIVTVAAAIFLLLCFLSSVLLTYRTSAYIIDSDASSELLLGKVLSEEGGILSKNWYYSTELRVLNTQLIYAPLFRVFDDWRTVRWVGQSILNLILAGSFLFLTKQTGIRRSIRFVCAGLVLLPMSTIYARIVLMHGYYVPHIAIAFCLLGFFFMGTDAARSAAGRNFGLCAFLLLSFAAGLGGIRQLAVSILPLIVMWLFDAVLSLWREMSNKKSYIIFGGGVSDRSIL